MNRALWNKAVSDAWVQLVLSSLLLGLFAWVFVWLMSLFKLGVWGKLLHHVPKFFEPLMEVPIADLAQAEGQISFVFVHPITFLLCVGWALGRGSDAVSGGIARGTMELILTMPVRRLTVLVVPAVVTTLGTAVLAVSLWVGIRIGLMTVDFGRDISSCQFLPGAVNLFAMIFCLTAVTTLLSSVDHDRWRTIWRAGGFFVISLIIKLVAQMWPSGSWLRYCTFLGAFEPQRLILIASETWLLSLRYNATLIVLGLVGYTAAAVIFLRRDIPVPR